MIRSGIREALQVWAFWLVPVILILVYGRLRPEDRPPRFDESKPGYPWLALPAAAERKPSWIGEWEKLSVAEPHDLGERDSPPVDRIEPEREPAGIDEARPFRIRLAGQVRDGSRVLYCFFDMEDQRWFRIAGGGVDPEAGISLEVNSGGGQPLVTDLVDGARYLLLAGEGRLERIGFEEGNEFKEVK